MATDWPRETRNHGNQLFGNSCDGGGGERKCWPAGTCSSAHKIHTQLGSVGKITLTKICPAPALMSVSVSLNDVCFSLLFACLCPKLLGVSHGLGGV